MFSYLYSYRQLLFTSITKDRKLSDHISGVILYHETFFQKADDGETFVNKLKKLGIVPGIKVSTTKMKLIAYMIFLWLSSACTALNVFGVIQLA